MLRFFVENPPVDIAEREWHIASKKFIGPNHSSIAQITINAIYTIQRHFAVWLILGLTLS